MRPIHRGRRTCSAVCWDATESRCDCICGGALHGRRREDPDGFAEARRDVVRQIFRQPELEEATASA